MCQNAHSTRLHFPQAGQGIFWKSVQTAPTHLNCWPCYSSVLMSDAITQMQLVFLMPLPKTSSFSSWSLRNCSILNNSTTISCLSPNSFMPKQECRQGLTACSWQENLSPISTEDSTAAISDGDRDHQFVASLGSSFPNQEASVLLRRWHGSISSSQTQRGRRCGVRRTKGCVSFAVLLWVFYLFLR